MEIFTLQSNTIIQGLVHSCFRLFPRIIPKPNPLITPRACGVIICQGGENKFQSVGGDAGYGVYRIFWPYGAVIFEHVLYYLKSFLVDEFNFHVADSNISRLIRYL